MLWEYISLFSHPEDFVPCGLETDRWLILVRRAFQDHGIRSHALASSNMSLDRNLAFVVGGDVNPMTPGQLSASGCRFVLILDDVLRVRRAFEYFDRSGLPSPLEFLGWAVVLRSRQACDCSEERAAIVNEIGV